MQRGDDGRQSAVLDRAALLKPSRLTAVDEARAQLAATHVPLDELIRLAARALDVPYALISIVDADQEHFFGAYGTRATGAPASSSLCQYVVSGNRPLVIDDTRGAAADHLPALARDSGVGAYASFPVHLAGIAVGAVCVADPSPRAWTDDELDTVSDTARLVSALLASDAPAALRPAADAPPPPAPPQPATPTAAPTRSAAPRSAVPRPGASRTDGAVAALDAIREAFVTLTAERTVTAWSVGAEAQLGWTADETIGRDLAEFVVADRSAVTFERAWARACRPDRPVPQREVLWMRYRGGHEFPADVSISRSEVAGHVRMYLLLHDATDRLAAERDLAGQRQFLDTMLESLDLAVAACDADGRLVLFNRALREMYGRPDGSTPDTWQARFDLYRPDGEPMRADDMPLVRALRGEKVRNQPVAVPGPGTRMHHYLCSARQLRSVDGELIGAVCTSQEVTELVRVNRFKECELGVSRALDRDVPVADVAHDVLDAILQALEWRYAELWLVDEDSHTLRLAATRHDGEREIPDFAPPRLPYGAGLAGSTWEHGAPVWLTDAHTGPRFLEAGAYARSGLRSAVGVPVRTAGQILGVLTFFADDAEEPDGMLEVLLSGVAAHVGLFLERRRASRLSTELSRTKDEYVALVGHEMRTPLTSISAYTDLLVEDPTLTDDHRQMLAVVQRNAATLRNIISDLLDFAALESGHAAIRLAPTDVSGIVRDALAGAGDLVAERSLTMVADVATDVTAPADGPRLRQVVDALLSNAVKYTPDGGTVTVRLSCVEGAAELSVADTGIGIPPEDRVKLFTRFFRGPAAKARGIPGSGLGLAIARAIVDKHGGTLALADTEGPGATFVLRLP